VQRSTLGVGSALRKVREGLGLTLEEAARDTRVRREFLEAIEAEEFDRLLGDVHVRGCLRTYATYLRLSPDKVVAAYEAEHAPEPSPATSAPLLGRAEPALGGRRRRDDHRLLILDESDRWTTSEEAKHQLAIRLDAELGIVIEN